MATISGGTKLVKVIREKVANISRAASVEVGFFPDARYPDNTLVAMVAAIQEYGAPRAGIPPRPYFRTMIKQKSPRWPAAIAAVLRATNYDAAKTLAQLGDGIAAQLRQSIIDTNSPPLSPVTLMLRMMVGPNGRVTKYSQVIEARRRVAAGEQATGVSTKPLIWTSQMYKSIKFKVKDN